MKNYKFKEAGITLVALVITVIVMLILASIVGVYTFDKNGLIDRKDQAKKGYEDKVNETEDSIQNINNEWKDVLNKRGIENSIGER